MFKDNIWRIVRDPSVNLLLASAAEYNGRPIEDTYDAVFQIAHSPALLTANMGSIFSIAFFNFFGVSVTKQVRNFCCPNVFS